MRQSTPKTGQTFWRGRKELRMADKSKITEELWSIVEEQVTLLRTASKVGKLSSEDHEALANFARVARTLSLHDPGEDAYIPVANAKELREALEVLEGEDE